MDPCWVPMRDEKSSSSEESASELSVSLSLPVAQLRGPAPMDAKDLPVAEASMMLRWASRAAAIMSSLGSCIIACISLYPSLYPIMVGVLEASPGHPI